MENNMNNENENTNWIRKIFILSKKSRIIIGIIIILLIILFIIFGIKRKPDIDTTYLTQILTKSSELTTAKLRITGLADYHDQGVYILNRSDFTMCYTTTIRAGINLDDVKITSDSYQKTIFITIPKAEIFEAKVDPNDIKFYNSGFALLNVNEKEDMSKALSLAEQEAMEYAKTTGILEMANQQSETLIKGLLDSAIPNGYKIEFNNN